MQQRPLICMLNANSKLTCTDHFFSIAILVRKFIGEFDQTPRYFSLDAFVRLGAKSSFIKNIIHRIDSLLTLHGFSHISPHPGNRLQHLQAVLHAFDLTSIVVGADAGGGNVTSSATDDTHVLYRQARPTPTLACTAPLQPADRRICRLSFHHRPLLGMVCG